MELTNAQTRALLAPVKCFLLDMDGTFYLGDRLLPGSLDFLDALHRTGRTARFLTNNSSKSAKVYRDKLTRMNVPEEYRDVITSGHAAAHYCLKAFPGKSAWVLGNDMLTEELTTLGLRISEDNPGLRQNDEGMRSGAGGASLYCHASGLQLPHRDRLCPGHWRDYGLY